MSEPGVPPAIELLSARLTYPDGTRALEPVDLRIAPGEFVTLLGPSGCGKSTLLKMVAGLLEPSDGRVLVGQRPAPVAGSSGPVPGALGGASAQGASGGSGASGAAGRQRLSFVFQSPTLMPWASVAGNVRLPLDLAGVPRQEAEARVAEVLALVGLSQFAAALPRQLSGGMQMRVSIARGLVTRPQLLLMDEPFGALDEITRHKLDAELLRLWRSQGLTVVFVTHSIQEAVFLSTRVVMMAARPGRVVDDFAIAEPYPRRAEFLVSARFAEHARRLQASLLQASGEDALFDADDGPAPADAVPVRN